jgi:succinate dehydrogenase / fumarate reductase cytochrome b subunit
VDERLKKAQKEDPAYVDQVNGYLQKESCAPYRGSTKVTHLLWALTEDFGLETLAKKVSKKLVNLNCAAFYGCYLLRAQENLPEANPFDPQSLEQVFSTVGANPIYYEGRTQCCGWPISSYATPQSFQLAGRHLQTAIAAGADCLVTPCPLCHLQLDSRQPEISKVLGKELNLPILHLPQLVGLAMGIDAKDLGLDRHVVSVKPVLAKLGLA